MIDKSYGKVKLYCDCCGECETFETFDEAVEHKKSNNWQSKKIKDVWQEYCPDCRYD
jgi:hypothetical protein